MDPERAPEPTANPRLILISNRLPVKVERDEEGRVHCCATAGGLATGLARAHAESGGHWIGWPGVTSEGGELEPEVQAELQARDMVGVALSEEEHERYYARIANRCIWPLFHYFTDRVCFSSEDWEAYRAVNERFAQKTLEVARPGDLVFVQDFHLMLVPGLLRQAQPDLRIGFFLHIPFPSSEILRVFPPRREVLEGLLGADVIGFHTLEYVRHFRSAVRRVLGVDTRPTETTYDGRSVRLIAQPLGIEARSWVLPEEDPQSASEPLEQAPDACDVKRELDQLREASAGRQVILGVERLDYTKGIPERLLAFRDLLRSDPTLVERVMMIQVAVPSRIEVEEYRELKDEVDRLAGAINSEFGRPGLLPLHYQFRSVPRAQLIALYRHADVAMVTPLRDGLNLVAKEYVAARVDDNGVLLLSEFTGAAWELGESLHVNPFDPAAMVDGLRTALAMTPEEQVRRMRPMRHRIQRDDLRHWVGQCLGAIGEAARTRRPHKLDGGVHVRLLNEFDSAARRELFLDYDGTLREFTTHPADAHPTAEVLELLTELARVPRLDVWVVSGRQPALLESWLGATGVGLIGEHGAFIRWPEESSFRPLRRDTSLEWRPTVQAILESFTNHVPGSLVEEKPLGMAWHYRASRPGLAAWQARELIEHLGEVLTGQGLEVLHGDKVVEVRPAGLSKGCAVQTLLGPPGTGDFTLAIGDDTTDESTFELLRGRAWTLLVGNRESAAQHRVDSPSEVRALLQELLDTARAPIGS